MFFADSLASYLIYLVLVNQVRTLIDNLGTFGARMKEKGVSMM